MSASTGSASPAQGGPVAEGLRERVEALDDLELEARAQLAALSGDRGGALGASGLRTLARLRRGRTRLRQSVGLLPARPAAALPERDPDLESLRAALSDVTYAYADAVVAASEPGAIGALVDHMKEVAGLLAVVELWIDEELRGG